MRRLMAVLLALGTGVALAAAPNDAWAGCGCGCGGCEYSGLNSAKCTYDGGCLCTLGGAGHTCLQPGLSAATFDGTISNETRVAAVQARDAVLTHRNCDGGVITRAYSARMSGRLRTQTLQIEV